MFKITSQSKLIIISLLLLTAIALSSVAIYQEYEKQAEIAGLDEGLKLKAPVENIIRYAEYDENGRPLSAPTNEMNGNLIKYVYRTNNVVPVDNYQGLKEDIAQRTPNAQIFLKSKKVIAPDKIEKTYVGKFYSGEQFQKSGDKWYQIRTATTTKSALLKQVRPTLLVKAKELLGRPVFAVDGSYNSGSGDGYVQSVDPDWATAHDASSGVSVDTSVDSSAWTIKFVSYSIARSFLPFDTSLIPSSATVSSASLSIYITTYATSSGANNCSAGSFWGIFQTDQPNHASLTNDDFNNCGVTSTSNFLSEGGGILDNSLITTNMYNTFVSLANLTAWVKKNGGSANCGTVSGITCLGVREGCDIVGQSAILGNMATFDTSEGANPPYLIVTYTVPPPTITINGGTVKVNGGTIKVNGAAQ